jgi:glycine/D-amino acid oxidase-like deaminating enzyme
MPTDQAEVVICGAGIAGLATAYHLTVGCGLKQVVVVDPRPPMSLTSDKSTECYRNWWPGPGDGMVRLMNRSIDLLEQLADESVNRFNLNRRGYVYATANPDRVQGFLDQAQEAAELGSGAMRLHKGRPGDPPYIPAPAEGYHNLPDGADVFLAPNLIQKHFPYLPAETVAVIHARRCGYFSAQQLGVYLLEQIRMHGGRLIEGEVNGVEQDNDRIAAVEVATAGGMRTIRTRHFVNAAGPMLKDVGRMVGIELPVFSELHIKVSFSDPLGAFPRNTGLLIWTDPQKLPWSPEERRVLQEDELGQSMLQEFPEGVHGRPEGPQDSPVFLLLWTYHTDPVKPIFPIPTDPLYPEIALRGMSTMIPALKGYFDRIPRPYVDGGYYTKTQENRPLAGPLPMPGAWVVGALSGFGLMAALACGELVALGITGQSIPEYARWFTLDRYQNPEYQALLKDWGRTGQL